MSDSSPLQQPPITDASGNVWRLLAGGVISLNGIVDANPDLALALINVNGKIWRQTLDQRWSTVVYAGGPWQPPGGYAISPVSETPEAQLALNEILNAMSSLQNGFANLQNMLQTQQSIGQILASIGALRDDFSEFKTTLIAKQMAIMALLNDILQQLAKLPPPPPPVVRISGGTPTFSANPNPPRAPIKPIITGGPPSFSANPNPPNKPRPHS